MKYTPKKIFVIYSLIHSVQTHSIQTHSVQIQPKNGILLQFLWSSSNGQREIEFKYFTQLTLVIKMKVNKVVMLFDIQFIELQSIILSTK